MSPIPNSEFCPFPKDVDTVFIAVGYVDVTITAGGQQWHRGKETEIGMPVGEIDGDTPQRGGVRRATITG